MKRTVMVVDDEESIVEFLEMTLLKENFNVIKAYSGEEALAKMDQKPDMVLLDVMMPGRSGFEVCNLIRRVSNIPVIMLTARDEDMDKIVGLEMGADDYVVKPFNPKELVARMKAIFRRVDAMSTGVQEQVVKFEEITLDLIHRKAYVGDKSIDLPPKPFDLLLTFLTNPDREFSREDLLQEVWGSQYMDCRSVDVHVKHVRKAIGLKFSDCIETVWGVGYRFNPKNVKLK